MWVCERVLAWLHTPPSTVETAQWQEADWEAARWAIQVHGIAPLLYQQVREKPAWGALPPTLQQYLANQYSLNQQRIHQMMAEQALLLRAAEQADIPLMPLKGSALLWHYYEDPALRPMADLDLLLHPEHEAAFTEILYGLGYQPTSHTPRHRSYTLAPCPPDKIFTEGEHPDNPRAVEIHTEARESFWGISYDVTDDLWAGARLAEIGEGRGWVADQGALLQHLLIHASRDMVDGKGRLLRLYDIWLVAACLNEQQWEQLLGAARRRGEERFLYAPLLLTERYLGQVVPSPIMAQLAEGSPSQLRRFLEQTTLCHLSFCNPLALPLRERLSWHRSGWEQGLAIVQRLLPSPGLVRQMYPTLATPYLLPLAYFLYLFNLLDGSARLLLQSPRRPWLRRGQGG